MDKILQGKSRTKVKKSGDVVRVTFECPADIWKKVERMCDWVRLSRPGKPDVEVKLIVDDVILNALHSHVESRDPCCDLIAQLYTAEGVDQEKG